MRYPFQSTGRPISHRNVWSFRVYMITLRDFVPEWNSRPGTTTGVNSRRGDSRLHDILWWYHLNKCRAVRGNRSELAPARKSPRCHVNAPVVALRWYNLTGQPCTFFFIKQQPNDYPSDSTFEGAHLPQFPQGIASLISDLILHCVSFCTLCK